MAGPEDADMARAIFRKFLAVLAMTLIGIVAFAATGAHAGEPVGAPVDQFLITPSTTQAGGHPDIRTAFVLENWFKNSLPREEYCGCNDAKNVDVHLPAGIIGVPDSIPRCNDADFGNNNCAPDSQIGLLQVGLGLEQIDQGTPTTLGQLAVFNLVPHPGQAALLGANVTALESPIYFVFTPRTGSDFGLDEHTVNINHFFGLSFADLTVWGVPADPSHQEDRHPKGCNPFLDISSCYPGVAATAPLRPFTINPTTCGEDLTATIDVTAYDHGVTHASADYPPTTGCDQLSFNPSLFAQPTTTATDTASGLDIDLKVPQELSPTAPSPSEIRTATVTLPEGFSINTNAADGKEACTDSQARYGTEVQAQCPEFSKIGVLSVDTPTLPGPLPGYLYLGQPKPGERYPVIIVADGYNVHVKLPGVATPDLNTGQLTVTFKDLPQFPFSEFNMHLFGAERGALATPTACGTYPVKSTFVPWDGALSEQTSQQFFSLTTGPDGKPCPNGARPFQPSFEAGVVDKTAGKQAPFGVRLGREDGEQNDTGLNITTPPGFTASLKEIPYCSEAAIAHLEQTFLSYSGGLLEQMSPSCPAASQVGTVVAGAGAGSRPIYVGGKVYLAGPYKGAPLSLEIVVPAVSGPYDLGNVAVRTAVSVNPVTAQVTATSDPLPLLIGGVPLRARSIQINLDRKGFALNPTNCAPFTIDGRAFGSEGGVAQLSQHFQVANCANLTYGPKLRLELKGGVQRRGHPAVHAELKTSPGEANTRQVSVTLPDGELLDNAHIETICTRVQFANHTCPDGSRIGQAQARSPLLDQPLSGPVYLRSSSHSLPDMVLDLRGQIDIEAAARIDTVNGRLRTTFESVPDVPIESFTLDLLGGKKGLLQNAGDLCGTAKRATVDMLGQNGRVAKSKVALNPVCGNASGKRHRQRTRQSSQPGKGPNR
jgi:hypothetical protein